MKRQLGLVFLVLGVACANAQAQDAAAEVSSDDHNVAAEYSPSAGAGSTLFQATGGALLLAPNFATQPSWSSTAESASPEASPTPAPDPKFIYGGRDDFRWQLAIGADWVRFRSSVFNASAVGIKSSVTYFTNDWFGVEGTFTTSFAPQIFDQEHVKLLIYGGGPKIAWRQRKWEPWLHAIVGGAHEQPQVAGSSRNAFAVEVGGGADYRFNPRLSGRLEGDWVRTNFFSQSQNNFELMGGVVFHF